MKGVFNNFELVLASNPEPGDLVRFRDQDFLPFREVIKSRIESQVAAAEKSGHREIVFSSEHLSSRLVDVTQIEALKQLFSVSCHIKIIVYLRRQDELFLGTQAEAIKRGNHHLKFYDPLKWNVSGYYGRKYYDYELMLRGWEEVFGKENILVRPYEQSQLTGGDVLEDFYHLISVDDSFSRCKKPAKENKRLSAQALCVISRLNSLGTERPEIITEKVARLDDFRHSALVPNSILEEFFGRFEISNRELAERYLNQEELFNEKRKNYDFFDAEDNQQVNELMTDFLSKVLFQF